MLNKSILNLNIGNWIFQNQDPLSWNISTPISSNNGKTILIKLVYFETGLYTQKARSCKDDLKRHFFVTDNICVVKDLNLLKISICDAVTKKDSSRFSSNSKAKTSETF